MALTEEQIEKLVAKVAGEIYGTRYTNQELKLAKAIIAAMPKPEVVDIDWPECHDEAMGCGLEDRNITDRYEAMRHGWECAIERVADRLPETLYAESPIAKPASEQNAVYQYRNGDGSWIDQSDHSYQYNLEHGHSDRLRILYTAPQPDYKAQRDALLEAHRKIVSDGDFSSPEGMKRIALAAIASMNGGA